MIRTDSCVLISSCSVGGGDPFEKVKKPFYGLNVGYAVITLIMFISSVSGADVGVRQGFAVAGSWIMAIISILVGVSFCVFASLLARTLAKTGKNAGLVRKLVAIGGLTAICYILMAVFWILSVTDESGFRANSVKYTAPFLAFDIISLAGALAMFLDGVTGLIEKHAPSSKGSSAGSKTDQSSKVGSKSGDESGRAKLKKSGSTTSGLGGSSANLNASSTGRLSVSTNAKAAAVGGGAAPAGATSPQSASGRFNRQASILGIGAGFAAPASPRSPTNAEAAAAVGSGVSSVAVTIEKPTESLFATPAAGTSIEMTTLAPSSPSSTDPGVTEGAAATAAVSTADIQIIDVTPDTHNAPPPKPLDVAPPIPALPALPADLNAAPAPAGPDSPSSAPVVAVPAPVIETPSITLPASPAAGPVPGTANLAVADVPPISPRALLVPPTIAFFSPVAANSTNTNLMSPNTRAKYEWSPLPAPAPLSPIALNSVGVLAPPPALDLGTGGGAPIAAAPDLSLLAPVPLSPQHKLPPLPNPLSPRSSAAVTLPPLSPVPLLPVAVQPAPVQSSGVVINTAPVPAASGSGGSGGASTASAAVAAVKTALEKASQAAEDAADDAALFTNDSFAPAEATVKFNYQAI